MKKHIVIGMIALLLVSSCGAVVFAHHDATVLEKTESCSFSALQFVDNAKETQLVLPDATASITTAGGYRVPSVTEVYTFPFKTIIQDVTVSFSELIGQTLTKPLQLSPEPIADTTDASLAPQSRTGSEEHQGLSFSYHIAAGTDGTTVVTYLAVHLYPVQYQPATRMVVSAGNAQITIRYTMPGLQPIPTEDFDLVIIAPPEFSSVLQPLVDHKISKGVTTKLVTREDICNGTYFPAQGRDCAEEMKYFIKNAYDQWGTSYVLLVGGRKGGILEETWWIAPRYSQLNDGGEGSYLTDLYFSDIYDAHGNFSSWDSNTNGVFAEWSTTEKDILDMYPDVFVGRLACTSVAQVNTMVDKIVTYETTTYGADWFKKFVGVAGDTYPDVNDPYYEGEMATNASFAQISDLGFTSDMVWTSNGRFTGPDPVLTEISLGCGFVHFSGHGNPNNWGNHPPQNDSFIQGPDSFNMRKLTNGDKQPIVIVGGCHNAQFNTSLLNILKGVLQDGLKYFAYKNSVGRFWYSEWVPRCWAWSMATQTKGGAIAVIANSGLGYGEPGSQTLTEKGRHLEWLFFKAYRDGYDHLGTTHALDLVYYMNVHPPMDDQVDCKIAQEWVLLGDPSLMIGGYPS
jgi:hypothetical protein